ncbi:hypothetical protein O4160_08590 [Rhodococcus sp. IEGM 1401]|uniref:nitroreductase family protein n=1 Tax=unclassified Rhodococcus (in: high G+C Gram-positive bacteria) TaxID=192944 RepID=UPI0022B376BE|nr:MULTISPECIES: hypothetical protein [unclassified Rhodococcus (in: high G+C Gram-positive bacteria)]MCZ4560899.1 hypothetical protein [Rhodococcus sp. IEGM 1401]MDI9921040.1 hypothetical protein [Rhodococcus sp. IEGM 1372]MDV8033360.1 hypothetical protein [Rhodococcus sp. IEGM 1414]
MKTITGIKKKIRLRAKNMDSIVRLRSIGLLADSYIHDAARYARASGTLAHASTGSLEANIVMDYHRVEKGLTLPHPRPWFGQLTIERLVQNCEIYVNRPDRDTSVMSAALGALESYREYFASLSESPLWWAALTAKMTDLRSANGSVLALTGGTEAVGMQFDSASAHHQRSFAQLAMERSSVRNFSERMIDDVDLTRAVAVAQTSPSVCNRQAARVRSVPRGAAANRILSLQNGNSGFGQTASRILIVTCDLNAFLTAGERNQAYIDGGLFAMTLIYALEEIGIASCCLNWSTVSSQDGKLRSAARIHDSEVVIMLVAIGYPSPHAVVTKSPKLPVRRVLIEAEVTN